MTEKVVSCGVIVTDGKKFLIGHVTGQSHWDIPKGAQEPNETPVQTALRELFEETGLKLHADEVMDMSQHYFRRDKDIHVFMALVKHLPPIAQMQCSSYYEPVGQPGTQLIEMDAYQYIPFDQAHKYVSPNLARIITNLCHSDLEPYLTR